VTLAVSKVALKACNQAWQPVMRHDADRGDRCSFDQEFLRTFAENRRARRCATTTLVSSSTLPAVFINLFAAFLDNLLQLVGFFRGEGSGCASENRLALFLGDPLEPVHEVGGHFQPGRQRLQIRDDVFERAHNFKVHLHDRPGKQQQELNVSSENPILMTQADATSSDGMNAALTLPQATLYSGGWILAVGAALLT
jgi:hypothetical protein